MGQAISLVILWITLTAPASAPILADDADAKKDLKQLQGTWELVAAHRHGKDALKELPKGYKITFRDDLWIVEFEGRKPFKDVDSRVKLDPSKSPKEFEWVRTGVIGLGASDQPFRLELLGIYEIDGDTLKLCWDVGQATGRRPTAFKTEAGTEHLSLELKRAKGKE